MGEPLNWDALEEARKRREEAASIPREVHNAGETPTPEGNIPGTDLQHGDPRLNHLYDPTMPGQAIPALSENGGGGGDGGHFGVEAPATPAAQSPPDTSGGMGLSMGPDLSGLSDVSSSSSSSRSRNIYRPGDEAALAAAQGNQAAAVRGQAEAEGAAGRHAAGILAGSALEMQQRSGAYQAEQDAIKAKTEAAIKMRDDAIAKYQQDAAHLPLGTILNPDAGQRVASVIGLLLSGAGSGLAHQPNLAAQILEQEWRHAFAERQAGLQAKREGIRLLGEKVADTREERSASRQDYNDWALAHSAIIQDRLKAAAELSRDPIAKANAEATIGALQSRDAEMRLERNKQIQQQTSSSHRASPLESAIKVANVEDARMRIMASFNKDQQGVLKDVYNTREKLGITASKAAWTRAYDASSGFKDIPGSFTRLMANAAADGKPATGIVDGVMKYGASWLSRSATNEKEREFSNALGDLILQATKATSGLRASDREGRVQAIVSGLGLNSSPEQIRDRLWALRDIIQQKDSELLRSRGIDDRYYQVVGENPFPERPTDAPIAGLRQRGGR